MRSIVNNRRVDTKIVTIVFTSTSSQADIDASMDDANALTKDDDTLIMVGINEKVNVHMLSTLNAFTVQGSSFDDKIALQVYFGPRLMQIYHAILMWVSTWTDQLPYQELKKLAKKWYVSPSWTDVSIGAYGSDGAPWFGGFWYHEAESYEIDLKNMSNIGPLGPPTKPYADYVATSGNDLIVVGMGSDFNANTLQNILGLQPITSITFSDALADENTLFGSRGAMLRILEHLILIITKLRSIKGETNAPKPGLGCDVDVLIAMDLSKAVPANSYSNQFNFLRDQVVSTWNINPWETEVAVGMFQSTTASWGAYAFRYANDAAFNEIFSIYAKKTPRYSTNIAL
uniref:VWFA domain-containing protein n=1 Tax=Parascaris equorum TaxID=6256 RepID=A0A914RMW7_PAREQ